MRRGRHDAPECLLRAVQDLAWQHSIAAGFDRAWYQERGLTWLVRFVDLRLARGIESGFDAPDDDPHHGSPPSLGAPRDGRVRGTGGRACRGHHHRLGHRRQTGPAGRVPEEIVHGFDQEAPTFTPARVHLSHPESEPVIDPWTVGVRDLDPMAHVNNATYLDIMDEVLAGAAGTLIGPTPPVRYEVEYLRSAMPRSVVSVRHWAEGTAWTFQLTDESDAELIRGRVRPG